MVVTEVLASRLLVHNAKGNIAPVPSKSRWSNNIEYIAIIE